MMKFTKKPIEVEARQFNDADKTSVYHWASEIQQNVQPSIDKDGNPILLIPTLEGEMICALNDWIIVEPFPTDWRKLYPCKNEIFMSTYAKSNDVPSKEEQTAIITESIEHWGILTQIDHFHEEVGELLVAISHLRRKRCAKYELIVELVDVRLMLDALKIAFEIDPEEYDRIEVQQWKKWRNQIEAYVEYQKAEGQK
jgi:hypothetical protein